MGTAVAARISDGAVLAATEVMALVEPAYGDSWRDAISILLSDRFEAETIRGLAVELRRDGTFREPVVVDADEAIVRNGMHRIVAAAFCGIPIEVTTAFADSAPATSWEVRWVMHGDGALDDLIGESWSALRSFPTVHGWIQTDHLGACDGVCDGIWDWAGDPVVLCAVLVDRATRSGLDITIVDAAPYDWDE